MSFALGVNDTYEHDRFLIFTEAAEILGSGNHTRIRNLVLSGKLTAYQIPGIPKLRVKKSELLNLLHELIENDKNSEQT